MWWTVGIIVYAIIVLWCWSMARVAADADRAWDEIVAKLDQEEAERGANKGA